MATRPCLGEVHASNISTILAMFHEVKTKAVYTVLFIIYNNGSYHRLFSLKVMIIVVPPGVPSSFCLSMISIISSRSFNSLSNSNLDCVKPIPFDSCVASYCTLYCFDNSRPIPSSSINNTPPLHFFPLPKMLLFHRFPWAPIHAISHL